jgi:hypothetical protein
VSPARRVLGYFRPCAARYGAGVGCFALVTGFSLGIPWQIKEAVTVSAAPSPSARSTYPYDATLLR